MPISACRVCGGGLFGEPLLRYGNMPAAAQNFPDAAALAREKGRDLAVLQCSSCGLVQLDGEPVPYYKEVIRAAGVSAVLRDAKAAQFSEFVRKYSLVGKKVLEIGCGRGEFLSLLGPLGVDAYGLEHAEAAVADCRRAGLNVFRGYPGETGEDLARQAPFSAFLLLMFLEHMPRPVAALRAAGALLSDGGVGVVEVPNFDMLLRTRLFSEFTADHPLYFTRETLLATLGLSGFEVLNCSELRDGYVLSAEVRKRAPLDVSGLVSRQAAISDELNGYLDALGGKKAAVWGAGHQALAVIAMAGIAGKIKYVVDSASFKQGRYTPATHLPVVAPEALRADPVDAVIVMAASYSDEVAGLLRRDFPSVKKIAVLRDFGLEVLSE